MAYYNYKHVLDLIPEDFRAAFEKQWLEETGAEFEGSLWLMAAAYIEELHRLKTLCETFVADQEIGSSEKIYQCDNVVAGALEFIEGVCDIVGYREMEDD